mmetsp:Transcript_20748/g.57643  ORF Transcript_20748/g.57643 Transcript_20748/m.57643 type:complete len:93 (-) Transcript_20748:1988-2266(-)
MGLSSAQLCEDRRGPVPSGGHPLPTPVRDVLCLPGTLVAGGILGRACLQDEDDDDDDDDVTAAGGRVVCSIGSGSGTIGAGASARVQSAVAR